MSYSMTRQQKVNNSFRTSFSDIFLIYLFMGHSSGCGWNSSAGVLKQNVLLLILCVWDNNRNITVTCLKSPATLLFVQSFVQSYIKENIKAPCHWPFVREMHQWLVDSPHKGPVIHRSPVDSPHKGPVIHRSLVDSPHKGPLMGKNVSMSWRLQKNALI